MLKSLIIEETLGSRKKTLGVLRNLPFAHGTISETKALKKKRKAKNKIQSASRKANWGK